MRHQVLKFFDAEEADTSYTYSIPHVVNHIDFDIIGTGSPDGTITFKIIGANETETDYLPIDYATTLPISDSGITSLDANGIKLWSDCSAGIYSIKIILSGMSTGSVTAYLNADR